MFHMHDAGWGWWLVMSIGMIAFWSLVIYAIVLLIRGPQRRESERTEGPRDVLKRRLAEGEISVDQYEQLVAAIEKPPREPRATEPAAPVP